MAFRNLYFGVVGGVGGLACAALVDKAYKANAAIVAEKNAQAGLASCQQKFFSFASARDATSGLMSMTYNDFVASLCRPITSDRKSQPPAGGAGGTLSPELVTLFDLFDVDKDHMLSYPEYCTLYTILSTPVATFERAFHMFDADGDARLSADEFTRLMRAVTVDRTAELDLTRSGIVRHLFGPRRDKALPLAEFRSLVTDLRAAIWRSEFRLADPHGRGFVAPGHLRRLVYRRDLPDGSATAAAAAEAFGGDPPPRPSDAAETERLEAAAAARRAAKAERRQQRDAAVSLDVPFDVEWVDPTAAAAGGREARRPAEPASGKAKAPAGMVTAEDYVDVLTILQSSGRWLRALKLYSNVVGADKCDVDALQRALTVSGIETHPRAVSLFFRLFDLDGSGVLEPSELQYLAATRASFFAKHQPSFRMPQRNTVQQWAYCMQQKAE